MRGGATDSLSPSVPAQRRYEALRSYFVEGASAASVSERFGYLPATVHQLAAELRAGRTEFFRSSKPGPRSARKADLVRDRVLELRAENRSVTEVAGVLRVEGTPVSDHTVRSVLSGEGIERLDRRRPHEGPAPRTEPVRARPIGSWPAGSVYECD